MYSAIVSCNYGYFERTEHPDGEASNDYAVLQEWIETFLQMFVHCDH